MARGPIHLAVHPSLFPAAVARRLTDALQAGVLPSMAHYLTRRQSRAWLALHAKFSPFFAAPEGSAIYEILSRQAAERLPAGGVAVISLGCGGGRKDTLLLECLSGRRVSYVPVDASLDLVLTSVENAAALLDAEECRPQLIDLTAAEDWRVLTSGLAEEDRRVILLYGMLPNVDLGTVGPRLVSLLRRGDLLLMSVNLARGTDYVAATQAVLPLYDNAETRAWLGMTLEELGLSPKEGEWRFEIDRSPWMTDLLRIAVSFVPARAALIGAAGEAGVELPAGRPIQLFHSNRFTVALVEAFAAACGLEILGSALIPSGDEGVFLATKAAGAE